MHSLHVRYTHYFAFFGSNHPFRTAESGCEEDPERAPDCYLYSTNTASANLRRHLVNEHGPAYDKVIIENGWNYPLSTEKKSGKGVTTGDLRKRALPAFSPEVFLKYLVRFIVADDQVSHCNLLQTSRSPDMFLVNSSRRVPRIS